MPFIFIAGRKSKINIPFSKCAVIIKQKFANVKDFLKPKLVQPRFSFARLIIYNS